MARLITKFKYLKPEDRKNVGGYAEYIATREGVEKIDESKRNAPATNKQKQLIKKILSDFPDSRSSLEYEDYLKEKTVGAASEFITRALAEPVGIKRLCSGTVYPRQAVIQRRGRAEGYKESR